MPLLETHNPGAPLDLSFGDLSLTAFSISGVATYVLAPGLDACFDLGHCPVEASKLRHVFLTHTHQDHAGGVHRHLSLRNMYGMRPSRIYVPAQSRAALCELLEAWARLEQHEAPRLDGVVMGVAAGERVKLSGRFDVETFDVVHRITSLGFTVIERRRKLREPYLGLPGEEIARLRREGAELFDIETHQKLTYIGDSTVETLRRQPQVLESEVLFVEVTHLPGTSPERSAHYGHTHLDELVAFFRDNEARVACKHIVIKHLSSRYGPRELEGLRGALPGALSPRFTILLPGLP